MDEKVLNLVKDYILEHLTDKSKKFEVYTVWKCKTLLNWKYLVSSSLIDGMYYEVTYDGNAEAFYLDAYKKVENKKIVL